MQRCCSKLRPLAICSVQNLAFFSSFSRLLSYSPHLLEPVNRSIFKSILSLPSTTHHHHQQIDLGFRFSFFRCPMNQIRRFSSKERKRKPVTPVTSKVKKTKMKSYSSFKFRFRTMNDGQIRRWRAGKRHNAHLKSKISKRRLRKPAIVHAAYAKVMKKLNFCG